MCTLRDLICKEVANVKPLYGLEVDVARILGVCAFSGKTVPFLSWVSVYTELGPEPGLRRSLIREIPRWVSALTFYLAAGSELTS